MTSPSGVGQIGSKLTATHINTMASCTTTGPTRAAPAGAKAQCTKGPQRRIKRWEDEYVVDAVQARLDRNPDAMRTRRETVEHPFGTLKMRMGATHFLMKTLPKVATEMALHVLAYNLTRVMNIVGINRSSRRSRPEERVMASAVSRLGSLSMARGCARIDAGPHTAKIGSADRVQVHHARLIAVIGVRKTVSTRPGG